MRFGGLRLGAAAVGEAFGRLDVHEDVALGAGDALVLVVLHLGAVDVVSRRAGGAVVERQIGVVQGVLAVAECALGLGADGEDLAALDGLRVRYAVGVAGERDTRAGDDRLVPLERLVASVTDVCG